MYKLPNKPRLEEQVAMLEDTLNLREEELAKKERLLKDPLKSGAETMKDSIAFTDSSYVVDSTIVGRWDVTMTCTQTSCEGFAVGDTKTERWMFDYAGKALVVKALVNNEVVRVYNGVDTGDYIDLVPSPDSTATPSAAKVAVRLRKVNQEQLEGERVIIRNNNCKVVFALRFEKNNE